MTDKKNVPMAGKTADTGNGIVNTYTMSMKLKNNEPVIFRFYAAWDQTEKQFSQKKYFENLLQTDAMHWSNN